MIQFHKTKNYLLLGILALSMFSFSCKKHKGDNEEIEGTNKTSTNLVPAKKGNWWLYQSDDSTISRTTVTGKDSFIVGNIYNYFETVDTVLKTITPAFYAKNESEKYYLSLIDLSDGEGQFVSAIICTFNPKVGDTWVNTSSNVVLGNVSLDVMTEGEVIATDKTVTLFGKTYKNVVETKNTIKAKTAITPYVKCGTITMQFVDGIGIIRSDLNVSVLNIITKKINNTLIDYHTQE